jgi:hypothetical protein
LIGALLVAILVVMTYALKHLAELRNLERDGYIREYQALEAILRHTKTCATQIEQLKRDLAEYAANREAHLEERKRILKSIAGHFKVPNA